MKPIIKVENLSKKYKLGESKQPYSTLRESLVKTLKSPFKSFQKSDEETSFWALNDINFEILPGEVVGIIGRNGAGKSTLLKVLSRITEPTNGKIELYGRVASLLEVGTGFHPELTGRENIFLNGAILGMKRSEIVRKFDEIVDFAEIEKFIDTPVKRYSSGMYVRLAFAVAASLEPEILVVDEVLAVGDAEFQRKCLGKMDDVAKGGRTVLFVSHNMGMINQLCKKGILLNKGKVEKVGDISDAVSMYLDSYSTSSKRFIRDKSSKDKKIVAFDSISMTDNNGNEKYKFDTSEEIVFDFKINSNKTFSNISVFLIILNKEKIPVCAFESEGIKSLMKLKIPSDFLVRGQYSIHTFLHIPAQMQFDSIYDEVAFEVEDFSSKFVIHGVYNYGSVFGKGDWL